MAYTGMPPAVIAQLRPEHLVRLKQYEVIMPGRLKGAGTAAQTRAIMPEAKAALERFAAAEAWGRVASSTMHIVWNRAVAKVRTDRPDWPIPEHTRPYDLRHTFGELVYRATHDLALTQGLLGHKDQRTTRRYAAGAIPEGEAAAAVRVGAAWRAAARVVPSQSARSAMRRAGCSTPGRREDRTRVQRMKGPQ
jgi:integrase